MSKVTRQTNQKKNNANNSTLGKFQTNDGKMMHFHDLMQDIEGGDRHDKIKAVNKLLDLIRNGSPYNLDRLVSHLFHSNDGYFNSNMFLLLSYIASKNVYHRNKLIRCKDLFSKAYDSLSTYCLSNTIGVVHYFTSLLNHTEDNINSNREEDQKCVVTAQNAIRNIGCLSQLCNFFTNEAIGKLVEEMWHPLCLCLSACCRGSAQNQNHLTPLMYKCIKHLSKYEPDKEVAGLVQSLVESNTANCRKFMQFGGINCFTRQLLGSVEGVHLLCSVIDKYPPALAAACDLNIPTILTNITSELSGDKKLMHWCSLALWRLRDQRVSSNRIMHTRETVKTTPSEQFKTIDKSNNRRSISKSKIVDVSMRKYVTNYELINGFTKNTRQNDKKQPSSVENREKLNTTAADGVSMKEYVTNYEVMNGFFTNIRQNDKKQCSGIEKRETLKTTAALSMLESSMESELDCTYGAFSPVATSTPVKKIVKSVSIQTIMSRTYNSIQNLFGKYRNQSVQTIDEQSTVININSSKKNDKYLRVFNGGIRSNQYRNSTAVDRSVSKTCDNTISMKKKLRSNDFLKNTVKKLKIGMALYGCNFKKIAEVFWTDDSTITPNILHGLFTKVIVQK